MLWQQIPLNDALHEELYLLFSFYFQSSTRYLLRGQFHLFLLSVFWDWALAEFSETELSGSYNHRWNLMWSLCYEVQRHPALIFGKLCGLRRWRARRHQSYIFPHVALICGNYKYNKQRMTISQLFHSPRNQLFGFRLYLGEWAKTVL